MIVGNGLIAKAFQARSENDRATTIFASGVSNSSETSEQSFARERQLLLETLRAAQGKFVYFSTCSLTDADRKTTPYVVHKTEMEALVLAYGDALVLRLPQVVGYTPNPHTLTNFLASRIASGERFTLWTKAIRSLIDVDDIASIATAMIDSGFTGRVTDIAAPGALTMMELVETMERLLARKGNYDLVERGGGNVPDAALTMQFAQKLGIDLLDRYPERVLRKYYGGRRP
ncbi:MULTISPECIES: NAD-dependent epimerase/dehydratase family protein [unclassified Lysobacter]|uniref:NAD-dependent epimerase/dehydratase family protein n=1 Tax=unclassified Lysobacter TaxID=2635362 RepID=UPI001BEB94B7|nr:MULTISPECIES: NAD-dependent epimerase/dehydratase family protein [unclassified Lysobacter]MBT2745048.1 NAD-dependent epimerase/dehydratase family protein [Lysobacter sp. ISL-42]MBT2750984.1 NAD-dependent epimerase/dehydratase family protein [Lysobacter sp. ISL-50]MBT2775923.1 NAD-dependent epimerase/dehydratase family protein [Lysobacter sp. ISL-54]MBT2782825.1 NAD-dependent epimerase/dehydratase family protein [Lysobacter sp. ISL-52]